MKISVITAVLNNKDHLESCIKSVFSQTYPDIEHIIIDGGSTDGTLDVISLFTSERSAVSSQQSVNMTRESGVFSSRLMQEASRSLPSDSLLTALRSSLRVVSEPDNGIYDALNKGIRMASGDVIGFLHADDLYADNSIIAKVGEIMDQKNTDSCYGDLLYVDKNDTARTIRYWRAREFSPDLLYKGWMPPHPTFFVRRKLYEKYGVFDTSFKIAADYELMVRFLGKHKISTCYIPDVLVKMRIGGASNRSISNILRKSSEDLSIMRMHNLGGLPTLLRKNLSKLPQFFGG